MISCGSRFMEEMACLYLAHWASTMLWETWLLVIILRSTEYPTWEVSNNCATKRLQDLHDDFAVELVPQISVTRAAGVCERRWVYVRVQQSWYSDRKAYVYLRISSGMVLDFSGFLWYMTQTVHSCFISAVEITQLPSADIATVKDMGEWIINTKTGSCM